MRQTSIFIKILSFILTEMWGKDNRRAGDSRFFCKFLGGDLNFYKNMLSLKTALPGEMKIKSRVEARALSAV
ncbi:hypothetical protein [Zongyangia hominis]|uniref:Uncharacterized protein n=1 Tax=Zongyangia hominis TaxID=2763677 RepID=A0A926IAR1_9FIRM|nr:hypothetical protein [Zongyangia hominis]MBC8569478.1 hypothetical protein [Zongyangia hominis]